MSEKSSVVEEKIEEKSTQKVKPPFQLCFSLRQELGRSYISQYQPKVKVAAITSKFYSLHDIMRLRNVSNNYINEIKLSYRRGPKENNVAPLLESHKCGWYTDPLIETDRRDRRLHFGKKSSDMVKMQSLLSREEKKDCDSPSINKV